MCDVDANNSATFRHSSDLARAQESAAPQDALFESNEASLAAALLLMLLITADNSPLYTF